MGSSHHLFFQDEYEETIIKIPNTASEPSISNIHNAASTNQFNSAGIVKNKSNIDVSEHAKYDPGPNRSDP